jgi:hypothetical protein
MFRREYEEAAVLTNSVRRAARGVCFALGVSLMSVGVMPAAHAASPIAAGDLVIYRVGDGSAGLTSASTKVFLDEYTPTGALVQSIAMPIADTPATGAHALTASGTATSEGELTISPDGKFIAATGYDAAPGVASIAGTASATVNRVVGILTVSSASVDTSTALNAYSANNPRSAVTDGTNIWIGGAGTPGVGYTTLGSAAVTSLSSTVTNVRQVNIFNGQLYTSSSSGSTIRLGAVGINLPTTTGQIITNLPGFETSTGSPYAYFFATLKSGDTSPDTVYVAEDTASGGQIQKWTLSAGSWSQTGAIAAAAIRGITGVVNGSSVTLFGTTGGSGATGGGSLYTVTDASGYGVAPSATANTIATAAANESFRGVALVPTSGGTQVPEAPLVTVLPVTAGAGLVLLSVARRRRRRPAAA